MTSFPRTRRHSVDAESLRSIELHWRVGARGALCATAHIDPADVVRLDVSLEHRDESRRFAFTGTVSESEGERVLVVHRVGETEADAECSIAIVRLADGETAVVTDLPERLGLRGGTYTLDRVGVS